MKLMKPIFFFELSTFAHYFAHSDNIKRLEVWNHVCIFPRLLVLSFQAGARAQHGRVATKCSVACAWWLQILGSQNGNCPSKMLKVTCIPI